VRWFSVGWFRRGWFRRGWFRRCGFSVGWFRRRGFRVGWFRRGWFRGRTIVVVTAARCRSQQRQGGEHTHRPILHRIRPFSSGTWPNIGFTSEQRHM
jgi:hypothetical protein